MFILQKGHSVCRIARQKANLIPIGQERFEAGEGKRTLHTLISPGTDEGWTPPAGKGSKIFCAMARLSVPRGGNYTSVGGARLSERAANVA
jgi:hypothetical protein